MKASIFKTCLIFALIVLLPNFSWSAAQRMGIAKGSYNLSPGGSSKVNSYCMDFTRAIPTSKTRYNHVLSSPENARVTVGNETMSMQKALDDGLISIKGSDITFSQQMKQLEDPIHWNRLSRSEQQELKPIMEMYKSLSNEEKRLLDNEFSAMMGGETGDYTNLHFVNNTNKPVKVEFKDNAILGENRESISGLNTEHIASTLDRVQQSEVQSRIWTENNISQQKMLKDLNYYDGKLDGDVGPKTKESIRSFQRDNGLDATGVIDAKTESVLSDASLTETRTREFNIDNESTYFVSIEPGKDGFSDYVVRFGEGKSFVYKGNDISKIVADVEARMAKNNSNASTLYFDMKNFSSDKCEAFASSCRIAKDNIDLSIRALPREGNSVSSHDFLFKKGVKIEKEVIAEPKLVSKGNTQVYETKASFFHNAKQVSLNIYTKSIDAAKEFFSKISNFFKSPNSYNMSFGDYINKVRGELRRKYNLEDDEIRIELIDEFKGIQLIEATPPTPYDILNYGIEVELCVN